MVRAMRAASSPTRSSGFLMRFALPGSSAPVRGAALLLAAAVSAAALRAQERQDSIVESSRTALRLDDKTIRVLLSRVATDGAPTRDIGGGVLWNGRQYRGSIDVITDGDRFVGHCHNPNSVVGRLADFIEVAFQVAAVRLIKRSKILFVGRRQVPSCEHPGATLAYFERSRRPFNRYRTERPRNFRYCRITLKRAEMDRVASPVAQQVRDYRLQHPRGVTRIDRR